jgi:hypothetical protein
MTPDCLIEAGRVSARSGPIMQDKGTSFRNIVSGSYGIFNDPDRQ